MTTGVVLRQMLRERLRSVSLWSLAIAALVAITGGSYPAVRDAGSAFDQIVETMPEGMLELFGAQGGLTTPEGYLNSQLYSNVLPILLLVYGIGLAGWTVAGAEREGTLESLLANPVPRWRAALERFAGTALLVAAPLLVSTVLLIVLRSPFELEELSVDQLVGVGVATYLLVLLFTTLSYAVGAATGSRGAAIAAGAGLATGTYVIFGLSAFVDFFENIRWIAPWHWLVNYSPLLEGWNWTAIGWPIVATVPVVAIGTVLFTRRDLR